MNSMIVYSLIAKDMRVFGNKILAISLFLMLMGLFVIFINTHKLNIFMGSGVMMVMGVLAITSIERRNLFVWRGAASLPIPRAKIVIGRYLFALLIVMLNLVLWSLLYIVLSDVFNLSVENVLSIGAFIYIFGAIVLYLSFFLFIFFRVRYLFMVLIYMMPFTLALVGRHMQEELRDAIVGSSLYGAYWCSFAILCFILSMQLSVRHFKNRAL